MVASSFCIEYTSTATLGGGQRICIAVCIPLCCWSLLLYVALDESQFKLRVQVKKERNASQDFGVLLNCIPRVLPIGQ